MIAYAWKKVKVRNAVIFKKALVSNEGGQSSGANMRWPLDIT